MTIALYELARIRSIINSRNTLGNQIKKEGIHMKNKLFELLKDEEGQAMTEYGLIIALIAVVVIVALTAMGGQLGDTFDAITDKLTSATPT